MLCALDIIASIGLCVVVPVVVILMIRSRRRAQNDHGIDHRGTSRVHMRGPPVDQRSDGLSPETIILGSMMRSDTDHRSRHHAGHDGHARDASDTSPSNDGASSDGGGGDGGGGGGGGGGGD